MGVSFPSELGGAWWLLFVPPASLSAQGEESTGMVGESFNRGISDLKMANFQLLRLVSNPFYLPNPKVYGNLGAK